MKSPGGGGRGAGGAAAATPPPSVLLASWKRKRVSRAGSGRFPAARRGLWPLFPAAPAGGGGRRRAVTRVLGQPGLCGPGADGARAARQVPLGAASRTRSAGRERGAAVCPLESYFSVSGVFSAPLA